MLTPLVVVLAISDDVHVIQHYDRERQRGSAESAFTPHGRVSDRASLRRERYDSARPSCRSRQVTSWRSRHFGIGAAVGVMVDFVSSLVLVPTLLTYVPLSAGSSAEEADRGNSPGARAAFAIRRPRPVLGDCLVAVVFAIIGMSRLRVDTNHIGFFSRTHPLSESAAVIDRSLAGVYSFHVMLEGPVDSLKSPEALRRLDSLASQIAQLPEVRKVTSAVDFVKRAHRELHGGRGGCCPQDSEMAAQEFFLIAMTGEGRRELDGVSRVISQPRRSWRACLP